MINGSVGILSFEISVGKHRMVVNCGSAPTGFTVWLRSTRDRNPAMLAATAAAAG